MRCIQALETHLTVTATEVEGFLVIEFVGVVTGYDATFAAYVEDAYLTAGAFRGSIASSNRLSPTGIAPPTTIRSYME